MIKANVRQIQHHLSEVLRSVEHGEEVFITRRNRIIAKIVPVAAAQRVAEWPDFVARAGSIVGRKKGKPASRIVVETREERV